MAAGKSRSVATSGPTPSGKFPAGSVREAVAALGDCWRCDKTAIPFFTSEHVKDSEAMLTFARVRLSGVMPAQLVEWREFIERNNRGEPHPTEGAL